MSKNTEPSNTIQSQPEPSKHDQLYNILLTSFEIFKKSKKDPNNQKIKEIITELKNYKDNFSTINSKQLMKYSLIFISPLEKCNTESMETILNSMEEILKKNLVEPIILQKMSERLIAYIPVYLRNNEIDYKVNAKNLIKHFI